ncbi:acylphosphatase [candidate division WWE3 bacterium CG06_land_8_20_14_3_00_42_16]|uniref:acylphosphatase n=3 Tax=Katanobacteria TaxID=422282 RepID=A0A2M7ANC8_UNCKA|nr:MAG: acylphosphatase [candidate division WWE3 bacterium CG06_land_8_20_14_3_00_42_16]PIZ41757.1 MAG: acylphosphatase [candidate division WWE3 bacterium CG_4_10_14_0_2_um_filter_42_8]PJC67969.1 MAG: acylphosphatase [candidate division WWE3 bacterium CG_4_8_14_3_um_filter_42_11]
MIVSKAHIIATGRVQGVSFRSYAVLAAREVGITGWVKNRGDGSVEIMAEGKKKDLEDFITWCHKGPPFAGVGKVEVSFTDGEQEYYSFEVVRE